MIIENLTKFYPMLAADGSVGMLVDNEGAYVRFSDVMDASSNRVQQLQAKIRAVISRIDVAVEKCDGSYSRVDIANELRELSAVQ